MELFRVESGPRIARVHRILSPLVPLPEQHDCIPSLSSSLPEQHDCIPSPSRQYKLYDLFSATCGRDTLVAMSFLNDQSVCVHRLDGDQLVELACIRLESPDRLLWLTDRLLVADFDREKQSHSVIELKLSDTRLERHRKLIATNENINVQRWCAENDGLAIFDLNSKDILHFSFV